MVAKSHGALAQGHIAVYARDGRWRRSMAKSLGEAGHSYQQAANAAEMRRLLLSQRFDVLALKFRDEPDARDVAQALEDVPLPPHGILVGNASALPLMVGPRHGGTFRYVPGRLTAQELGRLVEASITAGTWEEGIAENGSTAQIEEVDMEEVIESAASAVYALAKRRRLRFSTVVEGPAERAFADPVRLRRILITLLRLVVTLAPRGAHISAEARASEEDWTIRIGASAGDGRARSFAQLADALREETQGLTAVSRDVQHQGGLLWVELMGPVALALCLTLPFSLEEELSESV